MPGRRYSEPAGSRIFFFLTGQPQTAWKKFLSGYSRTIYFLGYGCGSSLMQSRQRDPCDVTHVHERLRLNPCSIGQYRLMVRIAVLPEHGPGGFSIRDDNRSLLAIKKPGMVVMVSDFLTI